MWPDCWAAFDLFARIRTQWRVGPGGATGLDYCAAYPLMDRLGLDGPEWDQMLSDLQTMEAAALDAMRPPDA